MTYTSHSHLDVPGQRKKKVSLVQNVIMVTPNPVMGKVGNYYRWEG